MKNIYKLLFVAMIAALFVACKKDEIPGPAGTNGKDGKDGTANIHTRIYDLTNTNDWYWDNNAKQYFDVVSDMDITQAVLDSGNVQIYYTTDVNKGWWRPMPFTAPYNLSTNTTCSWIGDYTLNSITVYAFISNGSMDINITRAFLKVVTTEP